MLTIFSVSFFCVLQVFLICLAGIWLVHKGILTLEVRSALSRMLTQLMLPALLITKIGRSVRLDRLAELAPLPLTAWFYVLVGLVIGQIVLFIGRIPKSQRRVVIAATAFGNSGYIPYPVIIAVAGIAPMFLADSEAASRGVAYISVYLIGMSPCLWGVGMPLLSGTSWKDLNWKQVISPPFLSTFIGITIGCVPLLRTTFVESGAPLRVLFDAGEMLGQAAIPCALIVLGANLAAKPRAAEETVAVRTLLSVAWGRLVVLPLVGCLTVVFLWNRGWILRDPMYALVLMVEAAVPSATNLVVMCQLHKNGEGLMSRVLISSYILAVGSLTVFVAFFLWIVKTLPQ